MDFDYSNDQKILQQSIRTLFKKNFPIRFTRNYTENNGDLTDLISTLAEQGLLSVVYEDKESINEGLIYSLLTSYEAGRVLLPFPLLESHIVSYLLSKYSTKENILETLISGEEVFTVGWKVKRFEHINSNLINGLVSFVPFANISSKMLVGIEQNNGVKYLLVDLNDKNVSIRKVKSMDQTYPLFEVTLKNYRFLPKDEIFLDSTKKVTQEIKQIASILISAEAIGACEEVLERTVEYTKERVQFGQSIGKFQAVKHQAAEMYLLLESSRAALKYASSTLTSNSDEKFRKPSFLLKSYVSESCMEFMNKSLQLHGGIGFTWESDLHMFFKRCKRISVMHGDAYEQRENIFNEILELSNSFNRQEENQTV